MTVMNGMTRITAQDEDEWREYDDWGDRHDKDDWDD